MSFTPASTTKPNDPTPYSTTGSTSRPESPISEALGKGMPFLWRLTLVALLSALILVAPGLLYGRVLTALARRIREQYARLNVVAEQAVASARTVHSFVAERRTLPRYSATKDIVLGTNGNTYTTYAFIIWYGRKEKQDGGYVQECGNNVSVGSNHWSSRRGPSGAMSLLAWNCRGPGLPRTVQYLVW